MKPIGTRIKIKLAWPEFYIDTRLSSPFLKRYEDFFINIKLDVYNRV